MTTVHFPVPDKSRRYWWVVASDTNPKKNWHWREYFEKPTDRQQRINWGGPKWIKSAASIASIQQMRKGDVVLAYQTGEGMVGLTRLAKDGYISPESGSFDTFDLAAGPTVWFEQPVPFGAVKQLPESSTISNALPMNALGTVHEVSPTGFVRITHLLLAYNPDRRKQVEQFIRKL